MTDMLGNDITYNNEDVFHQNGILVTNGLIHNKIGYDKNTLKFINAFYKEMVELFNTLKKVLSFDKDVIFGQVRNGDIPHSNANIAKADSVPRRYKFSANFIIFYKLFLNDQVHSNFYNPSISYFF